jgi:hypothetical protein
VEASARAVLVLGGQGVLGTAVACAFENQGWDVHRGGRRPDDRPGFRFVDLDDPETVTDSIRDVDVVVNAVPDLGLTAERIVLDDGGVLINISALPAAAGRELRERDTAARGLVLMNAGRTPGISNLVAADLLAAHPDADTVEIVFTFSASGASGRAGGEFLHRNLTTMGRHQTAAIPLPEPLGPRRCVEFAEPERGWLGEQAAERAVNAYACFVQGGLNRALLVLNRLGVMSRLPRAAFVRRGEIDPEATSSDPVREWVAVLRDGSRLGARTIEGDGGYPMTASATLAFVDALLDPDHGGTRPSGCFDPDELLTLDALAPRLDAMGVHVVPRA